jgi:hypothetical protein
VATCPAILTRTIGGWCSCYLIRMTFAYQNGRVHLRIKMTGVASLHLPAGLIFGGPPLPSFSREGGTGGRLSTPPRPGMSRGNRVNPGSLRGR